MREIKSRFWDRKNKKWEVFHIEIEVDPATRRGDAKLFHVPPDHGIGILPPPDFDPASRGEFTGLNDRNGKEIYEGDLVKDHRYGNVFEVHWRNDGFRLWHKQTGEGIFYESGISRLEVIGNSYENPELL